MSLIEMSVPLPTDDEKFFRRLCPICRREFKVLLDEKELENLAKKGVENFMLVNKADEAKQEEGGKPEPEYTCPYCGQMAAASNWWTDEQMAYIGVFAKNIANRIINEELISPLKRKFGASPSGLFSIKFDAQEMKMEEPWISPETNDMEIVELPCCKRKIKIREEWTEKVRCFFCGFPYPGKKKVD